MLQCGYCQEEIPDEHLHAMVEDAVRQCPLCIEHWCDDWEPVAEQLTNVIRERNQGPFSDYTGREAVEEGPARDWEGTWVALISTILIGLVFGDGLLVVWPFFERLGLV